MQQVNVLLDAAAMQATLMAMAQTMVQPIRHSRGAPWAVVGIRRGGDHLARRLAALIASHTQVVPPTGTLDINLYRDDGIGPHVFPQVGPSHLPFDVAGHTVLLVDDVLFTGRTVRAALDAIADYGRPQAVRLAVLVDRGLRELPICADAVGLALATDHSQHVEVRLTEAGASEDAVWLHPTPRGHIA